MLTLQNQPGNEQLIFILILATRSGFACDLTIQLKKFALITSKASMFTVPETETYWGIDLC